MIPILMYHQVAELPRKVDPHGLAVPPGQFEQQMAYLARNGFTCKSLAEAAGNFRNDSVDSARSFVLTFDDGYQDVLTTVWPILEKFGFTATVFLVSGCIGASSNWYGQEGARSASLLSWPEAHELAKRGFLLGSHTINHPYLTRLNTQAAVSEILNSKMVLENHLGQAVNYFSYPYSNCNAKIEDFVESAGYEAACAGDNGAWSIYHLWRVPCRRDDTAFSFALKARGWYDRRTAIRESAAGLLLRRGVRRLRRKGKFHLYSIEKSPNLTAAESRYERYD